MLINTSVFDTMRSMEPLLKLLSPYDPKPQYVQVATGGNWENAVRIDFGNGTFSHDISSLGDVDDSIACEIFYTLSDGRAIFFGIRKSSALKVDSPEDFLEKVRHHRTSRWLDEWGRLKGDAAANLVISTGMVS